MKRTKQQWLELIEQQQSSGLSMAEFCRQHDIVLKNFYARRSHWLKSQSKPTSDALSRFSQVTVSTAPAAAPALILQVGAASLSLPPHTDARWLAQLLGQLA